VPVEVGTHLVVRLRVERFPLVERERSREVVAPLLHEPGDALRNVPVTEFSEPAPIEAVLVTTSTSRPIAAPIDVLAWRSPATPIDFAVAATSANLHGGPESRRLEDVPVEIRAGAAAVVDGGELPGTPSTVLDLTAEEPKVLREGAVPAADALERAAAAFSR